MPGTLNHRWILFKKEEDRNFTFNEKCLYLNIGIYRAIRVGSPEFTDGYNKKFFIYLLDHVLFVEKQPSLL